MNRTIPLTLYPTAQRLSAALDDLVGGSAESARLAPGMMTIQAFERRLHSDLAGKAKKAAGSFARSILLSKVLEEHQKGRSRGAFTGVWSYPGFLEALLGFFDEFGAGLVTPDDLSRIKGYSDGKEEEILSLYTGYKKELENASLEDEGSARIALINALNNVHGASIPFLSRFSEIEVRDIYQFTPYRFELFVRLAKSLPVKIIAPAPDSRRAAFGFLVDNLAKFEELGENAGMLEIDFTQEPEGPLAGVKRKIFNLEHQEEEDVEDRGNVEIMACPSRYREVEEVGHRILSYKEKESLQWKDFLLVMRDPLQYAAIIEDVFDRYSIPYFMKKPVPLRQTPLARAALSVIVAIDSGYTSESVYRIMSSSYFAAFDQLDADEIRRVFNMAGIISGPPETWEGKLKSFQKRATTGDGNSISAIIKSVSGLLKRLDKLRSARSPGEFVGTYIRLLTWLKLGVPKDRDFRPPEHIRFRDNHSYKLFMETLKEVAVEIKEGGVGAIHADYKRIKEMFLSVLEPRSLPDPGTVDGNRVQALNVLDVVGLESKVVFVCGLHEGEFPQWGRINAVLSGTEREKFNKLHFKEIIGGKNELGRGRRVFDTPPDKWMEESLLFYQSLLPASQLLLLSYSLSELSGAPLLRSLFVEDMLDTLHPSLGYPEREERITKVSALAISRPYEELADPEEARMRLLRDVFFSGEPAEELMKKAGRIAAGDYEWGKLKRLVSLASTERGRDDFFAATSAVIKENSFGPHSGGLAAAAALVKKILADERKGRYSPTALEAYGQCPFRYFAGRVLNLDPEKKPELQMEARDTGSLIHDILERFYERLIMEGGLPLSGGERERKILAKAAEEMFALWRKDGRLAEEAVWAPERERILLALNRWLEREIEDQALTGFLPRAVELSFDFKHIDDKAYPPLALEVPGAGRRFLTGRIDRLDIHKSKRAIRIVDYKSGSGKSKYQKMLKAENVGRLSFQQPIYSLLAERWIRDEGLFDKVDTVTPCYRLLGVDSSKQAYITPQENSKTAQLYDREFLGSGQGAEEREGTFEFLAAEMIRKIEGGLFPIIPDSCSYCDFPGLCRYIAAPVAQEAGDE